MKKLIALCTFTILIFGNAAIYGQNKKTADDYINDLSSGDDTVVITAVQNLGNSKNKDAIDPLINTIKTHQNPRVRIATASSLGKMGTKGEPTTALRDVVMNDDNNSVVYASLLAILNLGDFDNPAAKEALEFCEENKTDDVEISDVVKRIYDVMSKKKK